MSHAFLVLVADDDLAVRKLVRMQLTQDEFRVITAERGEQAVALTERLRPDLIVLDLMLPGISGFEVMRRVHERADTPIVMLTARDRDSDKVQGLDLGAADYLTKPFNPDELTARVRAVLRRTRQPSDPDRAIVGTGDLRIDLRERTVKRADEPVALTRTEWNLLATLAENTGKVMLNDEILTRVWGPEYRDDVQYLRVWVARLRRKIEPGQPGESVIRTFPGRGYMLDLPFAIEEDGEMVAVDRSQASGW